MWINNPCYSSIWINNPYYSSMWIKNLINSHYEHVWSRSELTLTGQLWSQSMPCRYHSRSADAFPWRCIGPPFLGCPLERRAGSEDGFVSLKSGSLGILSNMKMPGLDSFIFHHFLLFQKWLVLSPAFDPDVEICGISIWVAIVEASHFLLCFASQIESPFLDATLYVSRSISLNTW